MPLSSHLLTNYAATLKSYLKIVEGYSKTVYMDAGGVPTYGYGSVLATVAGGNWSVNSEGFPNTLTEPQKAELKEIVENLNNKDLTQAQKKVKNDAVSTELQKISLTDPEIDKLLDAKIVAETAEVKRLLKKAGLTEAQWTAMADSRELAALVDMKFNGALFGDTINAYVNKSRAETWYSIRYGLKSAVTDGVNDIGLQKRRYWDAELVGLYNDATATEEEAKDTYKVLQKNRERIMKSEGIHGITPDGKRGTSQTKAHSTAFESKGSASHSFLQRIQLNHATSPTH